MIQLLGLRKFIIPDGENKGKEQAYDAFHDKNWRAPSVKDLFLNLGKYLEMIPENCQWNMFYTIANCKAEKRKFDSQDILPFDFDGIDKTQIEKYIKLFHQTVGVPETHTAHVSSGNGLHIILQLAKPFKSEDFFKDNRGHFKAIANKINYALAQAGLPGGVDTSVFGPSKILRLPGTLNRKPDKADAMAVLLKADMTPVEFDFEKLSGLPTVSQKEQLSEKAMRRFSKADNAAVLGGCDFLKWATENPNDVNEPQWYAALSIVGRLEDGRAAAHDLSRGHKGYSSEETDKKLDQALEASGPRTCDNINSAWGKCNACPNFKKKLSPLLLVGDGHIGTEFTGFHYITASKGVEKFTPCLEDLRLFMKRELKYKTIKGSSHVFTWNGTYYEEMPHTTLECYAYEHFEPKVTMDTCANYRRLVCCTEEMPIEWFEDSTSRKVNFLNGYYDFDRKEFLPHNPEIGFRSALPFKFDPHATCSTYDRMLEKITCGVKSMQDVLNEVGGYVISGDRYWLHKAIVLEGDGANGKSTWLNTLKEVMGRGNYSNLTMRDFQRSEYTTQMLDKKLANIAEEMPTHAMTETSLFKTLTSGGDLIVRAIRKEPYQIRNKAKMFFTCNELPEARDTTRGFFRRLVIVPFRATFLQNDPDFDPFIEEKLLKELPGIFNRFLAGYQRLAKQKDFTHCGIIDLTNNLYQSEVDTITTWVRENIKFYPAGGTEGKFLPMKMLYAQYVENIEYVRGKPLHFLQFSKKLVRIVPEYAERHKLIWLKDSSGVSAGQQSQVRGLANIDIQIGVGLDPVVNVANVVALSH